MLSGWGKSKVTTEAITIKERSKMIEFIKYYLS